MTPDEKSARHRHHSDMAKANGESVEVDSLLYAASCSDCAFRYGDECRAMPPRARIVSGVAVSTWPTIKRDDWCGCWRAM